MKKSIFSKLFITNLSIFLSLVIVLSVSISLFYTNHLFSQKKEFLANIAIKTENLYKNKKMGLINNSKLQNYIDAMGYTSQSKIYILNINQNNINNIKNLVFANSDLDSYLYQDLKDILDGNEVFRNSQYSETFDTIMIFYGRPIIQNELVTGAIIIFSPINSVSTDIKLIIFIIIIISLISIIVAGLLIFISAKSITKPMKNIRDSALKIANGEAIDDICKVNYIELNELTEAFNFMKNEWVRIDNDKRDFISMISHEIKTPLTVISGYLEAIHDGKLDSDEIKESLDIIYKEANRLTSLTKEIVTKTSEKDQQIHLEQSIFKLKPLLYDIIKVAKIQSHKTIQIDLNCKNDITIYADENKFKQIISNLISNSIKYSNASVNIDINCYINDDKLYLQVKDTGIGIKKYDLGKVFDKHYRVRNIKSQKEGSGLGLNIVKRLVELHNGTIEINSEYKKGTTVTMWFPL